MFVEVAPLILGTSTSRDTAKTSWREVIKMAEGVDVLAAELDAKHIRETIGEEAFYNTHGSVYRFAAPNRRAGRSLTVHRIILDELREHATWDAWNAAVRAMNAVSDGQAIAITNQGDDRSIVLDSLRDAAIDYIETGEGDPRLGLFEYSSPDGADPTDLDALAQANPNLGRRIDIDSIIGDAVRAKRAGGLELAGFRTEVMCQRVAHLNTAIDMERWATLTSDNPIDLAQHRQRVALCLDVSLDGTHAILIAAAVLDGIVHLEVVESWADMSRLRVELVPLVTKVRPAAFGWFPAGPAAAIASGLADQRRVWPPRRVTVEAIRGDVTACCMGLALEVSTSQLRHPDDPLLNSHLTAAGKLQRGDQWVFQRRGAGPVNGAYAAAGAVHLARTLPPPAPPLMVA